MELYIITFCVCDTYLYMFNSVKETFPSSICRLSSNRRIDSVSISGSVIINGRVSSYGISE